MNEIVPALVAAATIGLVMLMGNADVVPLASDGTAPPPDRLLDLLVHWHLTGVFGAALAVSVCVGVSCFALSWTFVNFERHSQRAGAPQSPSHVVRWTDDWQLADVMVPVNGVLAFGLTLWWFLFSDHNPLNLEL